MRSPTPNTYLFHFPDMLPTSNNYSSEAPLIRNQMAHTPVDTHYAAPVNTPILPILYLALRTHSTITNTSAVCIIYSITCTKCSILYVDETCRKLNARFGKHLRSVEYQGDYDINVAIHFNLPNHSINYIEIFSLLFAPTKKLPRKALEKKLSSSLEQLPRLD